MEDLLRAEGEFHWEKPPEKWAMHRDAWSHGQMTSKLWMCEIIEQEFHQDFSLDLWVFGSWYALLPVLLLCRSNISIRSLSLFDLDLEALRVSRGLLENWICQGLPVKFRQIDCLQLRGNEDFFASPPDLLVNSSCEHFESHGWLNSVPKGVQLLLQSTDMHHFTHINSPSSLTDFKCQMEPLMEISWAQEKEFKYPDQCFNRYALFGKRKG